MRSENGFGRVVPVKKKKPGSRSWMRFDSHGVSELLELDRNAIMQRASIPARDLRILGPVFSQSSHILARERAMVVNLEFIKAIVTAEELFLLDATSPAVLPFVDQLKEQFPFQSVSHVSQVENFLLDATSPAGISFVDQFMEKIPFQNMPYLSQEEQQESREEQRESREEQQESREEQQESQEEQQESVDLTTTEVPGLDALQMWNPNGYTDEELPAELPFEFRILEIALDVVCNYLELKVTELELKAYPTLDEFTRNITSSNLELVRSLKSVLTRLTAKVQKVRDELEQLLDDDDDMADLYLTRKPAQDQHIDSSSISLGGNRGQVSTLESYKASNFNGATSMDGSVSLGNDGVEELEMLLEAYFMQLDGTLNKLTLIREYIHDTEDYINIQLDHKRNQLFQFQITLTAAVLGVSIGTAMFGACSMNIQIPSYQDNDLFLPYVLGTLTTCTCVFSSVITYVYWKGLFER